MNTTETPAKPRPQGVSLFLRADGTMLLVKGAGAIEIALTPEQMLALGLDLLSIAASFGPVHAATAASIMERSQFIIGADVPTSMLTAPEAVQ